MASLLSWKLARNYRYLPGDIATVLNIVDSNHRSVAVERLVADEEDGGLGPTARAIGPGPAAGVGLASTPICTPPMCSFGGGCRAELCTSAGGVRGCSPQLSMPSDLKISANEPMQKSVVELAQFLSARSKTTSEKVTKIHFYTGCCAALVQKIVAKKNGKGSKMTHNLIIMYKLNYKT